MSEHDTKFTVKGFVDQDEIPSWARRPPKWSQLLDTIRALKPGQTIVIEFPTKSAANRARNVVRDELNSEIGRAAIRTRLVSMDAPEGANQAHVYFTRLHPVDIIESED
jgi:hypothetical protein